MSDPSASGGYASGRRTRARIIAAALRVFGEHGYERASTRRIAACAGVNTPAIQYYFGGKQGLHAACTRHVIGRMSSLLALPLQRAREVFSTAEPTAALDAMCELLAATAAGLACLMRDGSKPMEILFHEQIGAGLFDAMARLIAAATGHAAGGKLTRLRACMLLGQVSSLYENGAHTLAVMDWPQFDEQALALIKAVVREHTRGALATSPAAVTRIERQHRRAGWAQPRG
jgi:AcrR family transcriptional regulator